MDKNDSQYINELGGPSIVAKIFGISQASVSEWKSSGIPSARKQTLALMYPETVPKEWAPPGAR